MNNPKKTYEQKRDTKRVSFNIEKDADILFYIKDKEFSTYVKKLIRADMDNNPVSCIKNC